MPEIFHYDENPALYISRKFTNFERYWKDILESESTDNWEMYNGWDQWIRRRGQENRSSLQLPILYPAVEGRVSQIMARLKSREPIIRFRARNRSDPYSVLSALKIQQWVRDVLERQDWFEEIAVMMMAAEVFPICWLKCRLGELPMSPYEQKQLAELFGLPPQLLRNASRTVPEFEVLSPGSVFFDYRCKNPHGFIEKFHWKDLTPEEVHDRYGADTLRKIEHYESSEPAYIKEWEESAGRRSWRDTGEPRYRLAEGWIMAQFSDGRVERRVVRFFPDVVRDEVDTQPVGMLMEDDEPPISFDPFRPIVSRRLPFHLLGKSTVALGKPFQREAAEITNMALDILGYTAAPPIVMAKGAVDNPAALRFAARSLWMLNDTTFPPQPLHVPTPNAPLLDSLRSQMEANLGHVTAAYEGITGQPSVIGGDETLGQYRQRTASGQGRLDLPFLGYAGALRGLAEKYWYYMREYPRMLLGRYPVEVQTAIGAQQVGLQDLDVDAEISVPNLTDFENDEIAKIEFDRLTERLAAMPAFALNPVLQQVWMQIYIRKQVRDPADMEDILRAMQQPLQPELGATQNGRGMPLTQFSPGTGNIERNRGLIGAATAGGG